MEEKLEQERDSSSQSRESVERSLVEQYFNLLPEFPEDILERLFEYDFEGSLCDKGSIFTKDETLSKYYIGDDKNQQLVIDRFIVYLNSDIVTFKKLLEQFVTIHQDEEVYIAYNIQKLEMKLRNSLKNDILQIQDIEWSFQNDIDVGDSDWQEVFEAAPYFLSKLFKAFNGLIRDYSNSVKQDYEVFLSRRITSEDVQGFKSITENQNAKVTTKILFLNELGLIDSIKKKYEGISNRKIALLIRACCFSDDDEFKPKDNTLKRIVDSIEKPATKKSTKNNPYHSHKNLEAFHAFIDKWNIDKIE
jgi:hypothetical protein